MEPHEEFFCCLFVFGVFGPTPYGAQDRGCLDHVLQLPVLRGDGGLVGLFHLIDERLRRTEDAQGLDDHGPHLLHRQRHLADFGREDDHGFAVVALRELDAPGIVGLTVPPAVELRERPVFKRPIPSAIPLPGYGHTIPTELPDGRVYGHTAHVEVDMRAGHRISFHHFVHGDGFELCLFGIAHFVIRARFEPVLFIPRTQNGFTHIDEAVQNLGVVLANHIDVRHS